MIPSYNEKWAASLPPAIISQIDEKRKILDNVIHAHGTVGTNAHAIRTACTHGMLDIVDVLVYDIIWQHSHDDTCEAAAVDAACAALLLFAVLFVAALAVSMLRAGAFEFWHVWGWFGYMGA